MSIKGAPGIWQEIYLRSELMLQFDSEVEPVFWHVKCPAIWWKYNINHIFLKIAAAKCEYFSGDFKSWQTLTGVHMYKIQKTYRKSSNIRRNLVGNKIVDHTDVVGASPFGAAPTTSSFSTWHLASRDSTKKVARQYENLLSVGIWCALY